MTRQRTESVVTDFIKDEMNVTLWRKGKIMKKPIFSICFALILFIQTAFACSLSVQPIGKFDETEFIFIGEVIGFTQSVESAKLRGAASGLIVKVKESVYLPKTPKTYFEIFPIQLWADCSKSGTPVETLKKNFPVNSEIRVIAKESQFLPANLPDGNIRLEERPGDLSSISLNYDEKTGKMTSADSVLDYKSFEYIYDKDSDEKYLLPNFEIRKDLLRLKKAQNHKEVVTILDRLLFAPVFSDLDFHAVFKNFTLTEVEFSSYYETQLKMTDPETFKQYKAYNDALSELLKLGFERAAAEKALGKALEEGTEISKQKLFEKSLQILRSNKSN